MYVIPPRITLNATTPDTITKLPEIKLIRVHHREQRLNQNMLQKSPQTLAERTVAFVFILMYDRKCPVMMLVSVPVTFLSWFALSNRCILYI